MDAQTCSSGWMMLKPPLGSVETSATLCGWEDDAALVIRFASALWGLKLILCPPGDSGSVFPWCGIIIYNEALREK